MINIDISEVVIKQMREWNRSKRPDLPYEVMDVTKMTYSDEKFSVVLDKGTLDAIMPDITDTTLEVVDKFFQVYFFILQLQDTHMSIKSGKCQGNIATKYHNV